MRGFVLGLFRFSAAILATSAIVVPFVVLLGWSAWYAFTCVDALSAPGVPVTFSYQGQGGTVVLTANRYAVDLMHLTAFATEIQVRDDKGYEFASVDRIYFRYDQPRVFVDVDGARVNVERLKETLFSFQKALPIPSESKTESPYVVTASRIRVHYTDASRAPSIQRDIDIDRLKIEGNGGQFELSASFAPQGVGDIPVVISRDLDGTLAIHTGLDHVVLMPLVPHIERWIDDRQLRDYQPYAADSIVLSGPVDVAIEKDHEPRIVANLTGSTRGLRVGQWVNSGSASFSANVRNRNVRAVVSLIEPRRTTKFDGALSFGKRFSIAGNASVSVASKSDLWPPLRRIVPQEAKFRSAEYRGAVFYDGNRYAFSGALSSESASWRQQSFLRPTLEIGLTEKGVVASGIQTRWQSESVTGNFQYEFGSGKLSGGVAAPRMSLAKLGASFDFKGLSGVGNVQALLSGTVRRPLVTLAGGGIAQYERPDHPPVYLGLFSVRGNLDEKGLRVTRAAISGPNGAASATGTYRPGNGTFAFDAVGGGLQLKLASDDLSGLAFAQGHIVGTTKKFSFGGALDIYGGKYGEYEFPVVTAAIDGDERHATASGLTALVGSARAEGSLNLVFDSGAISGSLSADRVALSDWLGSDFAGTVAAQDIVVGGTLKAPEVTAKIDAKELLAYDQPIDEAHAELHVNSDRVEIREAGFRIGKGQGSGSGTYNFSERSGTVGLIFAGLPLGGFRLPNDDFHLMGFVSGSANGAFDQSGTHGGVMDLQLRDLGVNGQHVGDGSLSVKVADKHWSGSAAVGEVDPPSYVRVQDAKYDESSHELFARFDALGLPLEDVIRAFSPESKGLAETPKYLLQTASGKIAVEAALSGSVDAPKLAVQTMAMDDLKVGDRSAGKIEASGDWSKGDWNLKALSWKNADTSLRASGQIQEGGDLKVEGELSNFDLTWLALLNPTGSSIFGKADLSFALLGKTENPEGIGSLGIKDLGYLGSDGKVQALPVNASLDTIELKNRTVTTLGAFAYEDFSGVLQASVPLSAFSANPDRAGAPVHAQLDLRERNLSEFTTVFAWMDPSKTRGKLGGKLQFTGFPDDYQIDGSVGIREATLAVQGIDTFLDELNLGLTLDRGKVSASGTAKSSSGGAIALDATIGLPDSLDGVTSVSDFLQQAALTGAVKTDHFAVIQNPNDRNSRIEAAINGQLNLGGNLFEPVISGLPENPIVLSNVNAIIPSEFASQPERAVPFINPRFSNIHAVTKQPANVRTSTASISLSADGELNGSLSYPNLQALLTVVNGVFKLPTSKVDLEPGGKLRFSYAGSASSEPVARLDANLEGSTYVSALRLSDIIDRYRIDLFITGNLLATDGLSIRATSDPPGLSQEQILGLIGQTSLLESLTNTALNRQFGVGLSTAIYGLALPTLLNPLTSSIASNLKLDYLNIEYNSIDQISMVAAKSIGHGWALYARRQISAPISGRQKYELKFTYRIPFKQGELSRVALGIGFDQDRPWKLTLDYGRRF